MWRVTEAQPTFFSKKTLNSIIRIFAIFVPHLPIAPGTCKKVVKELT